MRRSARRVASAPGSVTTAIAYSATPASLSAQRALQEDLADLGVEPGEHDAHAHMLGTRIGSDSADGHESGNDAIVISAAAALEAAWANSSRRRGTRGGQVVVACDLQPEPRHARHLA